jgi:peptide/nickel transport system substrate-binding protein
LQLLYECGWEDLTGDTMLNKLDGIRVEELKVNIITYNDSTSSVREKAAQAIAGNLNAVGIVTAVSVLSREGMVDRLESGDYDLALVGVNLSEVPVLQPLLHSDGSLNMNGHSNEEIDTLIAKSAVADDEASLKQIYSQLQLLVVEQLPIMGLLFRTGAVLATRSMGGMSGIRELEAFRGLEYLME